MNKISKEVLDLADEILQEYSESTTRMDELLASIPVHSFTRPYTFEDVFLAYCISMNSVYGDEFYVNHEGLMKTIIK